MKRWTVFLLILCLAVSCAACGEEEAEHTAFYYLRTGDTIAHGQADALIAPVLRDSSEDTALDDILQLYVAGPTEEGFRNPFPKGTYLLSTIRRDEMLVVVLSREFTTLDGIQLTLAGACLAATCYDLTGLEHIQVRSSEQVYDFYYHDYVFLDESAGN